MDNDRLKHSYEVANKMTELGKKKNLSEEDIHALFLSIKMEIYTMKIWI